MSNAQELVPDKLHLSRTAPPMRRSALVALCALVLATSVGYALTDAATVAGRTVLLLAPVSAGFGAIAVGLDLVVEDARRTRTDLVMGVAVLVLCLVAFVAHLTLGLVTA